jgi:hypothetical protein
MDKIIRKVTDLVEQQAETYRYWRSRTSAECFDATYQHSVSGYHMYRQKGAVSNGEVFTGEGPARSFARVQRKKS